MRKVSGEDLSASRALRCFSLASFPIPVFASNCALRRLSRAVKKLVTSGSRKRRRERTGAQRCARFRDLVRTSQIGRGRKIPKNAASPDRPELCASSPALPAHHDGVRHFNLTSREIATTLMRNISAFCEIGLQLKVRYRQVSRRAHCIADHRGIAFHENEITHGCTFIAVAISILFEARPYEAKILRAHNRSCECARRE